jgi:phage terminase large subunit GpA-like protein
VVRGIETSTNRNILVGAPVPVDVSFGGRKISRGARFWPVNTGFAKDEFYGCLRLDRPNAETQDPFPPGYCHYPQMNAEWFRELTNEALEMHVDRKGYRSYSWVKHGKNEALDCRIYARAAAFRMGIDRFTGKQWRDLEESVKAKEGHGPPPSSVPPAPAPDPGVPPADSAVPLLSDDAPPLTPPAPVANPEPPPRQKMGGARRRSSYAPRWSSW